MPDLLPRPRGPLSRLRRRHRRRAATIAVLGTAMLARKAMRRMRV